MRSKQPLPLMIMVKALFGDTSFLYVLADADNADHPLATAVAEKALRQHRPIIVTTYVVAETQCPYPTAVGLPRCRSMTSSCLHRYERGITIAPCSQSPKISASPCKNNQPT